MNRLVKWLRQIGAWIRPFFASLPRVAAVAPTTTSSDPLIREKIVRGGDRRFASRPNPTKSVGDVDLRAAPTMDNERRTT